MILLPELAIFTKSALGEVLTAVKLRKMNGEGSGSGITLLHLANRSTVIESQLVLTQVREQERHCL